MAVSGFLRCGQKLEPHCRSKKCDTLSADSNLQTSRWPMKFRKPMLTSIWPQSCSKRLSDKFADNHIKVNTQDSKYAKIRIVACLFPSLQEGLYDLWVQVQ